MSATLGLHAERGVDPARYALGGLAPRWALRPSSVDEAVEALRAAARDRLRVLPWGGGTRLGQAVATGGYDVALDLSGLDRILEYEPEDFTLTAQCGATLGSLRAALAARGQELPLESPQAARATLGGTLAVNGSGPRRLRFGSPADRLLGARFVLADGTLARAGGKVVKNVAGLAVHRLLCGSHGRLAVILPASLKLAPAPAERLAMPTRCRGKWGRRAAVAFDRAHRALGAHARERGPCARRRPRRPRAPRCGYAERRGARVDGDRARGRPAARRRARRRVAHALGEPASDAADAEAEAPRQLTDLEEARPSRLAFTSADLDPVRMASAVRHDGRSCAHAACGRLHLFADLPRHKAAVSEAGSIGFHGDRRRRSGSRTGGPGGDRGPARCARASARR